MPMVGRVFLRRGWISASILVPIVALAVFSRPHSGEGDWGDIITDFLAWLVLGAGVFLRLWATLYIGGRKSTSLVRDGPYALCRHPLYVASFLIVASLALYLQSLTILAGVMLTALVYAVILIPSEERHLLACLGDVYRDYCRAVPRLLPRWRTPERPGIIEVKVGEFLREYARTFGLIALGAAAEFLAYVRAQAWWPTVFHLP